MNRLLTRRRLLVGGAVGAGALALGGSDATEQNAVLRAAEPLTMGAQRILLRHGVLAREFSEADISPTFRVNGTQKPDSEEYATLHEGGFAGWNLSVDGLVDRLMQLSLADLKKFPSRSQITRHDCVEGLERDRQVDRSSSRPSPPGCRAEAQRPVHCLPLRDELEKTFDGSGRYYESIDLVDAFHPQTILAYAMNDSELTVGHGMALRFASESRGSLATSTQSMSCALR